MVIIERYILREVFQTFLGVTLLLLLIFLSGTFVRLLAEVAEGDYPASILFSLFALKGLSNLVLVLPLSLFLGVLLGLGRLYNDSEMAAMTACGVGPRRILRAVAWVGVMVCLLIGFLSLYLSPWAEEKGHQLLDQARSEAEIEGLAVGRFNELEGDGQLIYVEAISADKRRLANLFAFSAPEKKGAERATGPDSLQLLTAQGAYQMGDRTSDDRFLVLTQGHRYEGDPAGGEFRIIEFEEHGLRIRDRELVRSQRRRNAMPTMKLLDSHINADRAEFQWRMAMPISAVLLALLAVPLSKTNPRQGRYGRLFAGIMIYIIYNNLLTVSRSSLGKGELDPWLGLWWVHLALVAVLIAVFVRQRRMPGPKSAKGATA